MKTGHSKVLSKELEKYTLTYYARLVQDTFKDDGDFATEWARLRVERVLRLLAEPLRSAVILDAGCGMGTFTAVLSKKTFVVGCDFSRIGIRMAKFVVSHFGDAENAEFVLCDLQKMPFRDGSFDELVAADLVEHLYDSQCLGFLRQSCRVLKRGGNINIYTPNPLNLASPYALMRCGWPYDDPTHIGLKSPMKIIKSLLRIGFEIKKAYCVENILNADPHGIHGRALKVFLKSLYNKLPIIGYMLGGRTLVKGSKSM